MPHAPSLTRLRALSAATLCLAVASVAACKDDEGTTPSCVADLGGDGVNPADGGCNPYPTCRDDAGVQHDPTYCCMDPDAGPNASPTSEEKLCLCGFGIGHCDNLGAGGSTSAGGAASGGTAAAGGKTP